MPEQSSAPSANLDAVVQAEQPSGPENPVIEQFPLIPSPTEDEARKFAVDSLNADFEESLVFDLATESKARELDRLFAELPMIPKTWLQKERQMGTLRNPFQPAFRNGTAAMAIEAAALTDPRYKGLLSYLRKEAGIKEAAPNYEREAQLAKQEAEKQRMIDFINSHKDQPYIKERKPPVSGRPLRGPYASNTLYRD